MIEELRFEERIVVRVAGEIEQLTVPMLRDAVERAIGSGVREVWLDVTEVGYIDSTGIKFLA